MNSAVCDDDNDCGPNFYCYNPSKRCVNFTNCLRYNRAEPEDTISVHSATQCGPCISGYVTEILGDGTESSLCQRNETIEKHYLRPTINQNDTIIMIIIIIGISIFIMIIIILLLNFTKKYCIRNDPANTTNTDVTTSGTNNNTLTIATAPLEEKIPFIALVGDKYRMHDNNGQSLDVNEYQTASPYVPPVWAEMAENQFYRARVSNGGNIIAELQNNIPDDQIMEPIIELSEVNIEQQDNSRNTALLQTYPSDNTTNPSPEPNKSSTSKKTKVVITQSLNQNINMNVNIFNENE